MARLIIDSFEFSTTPNDIKLELKTRVNREFGNVEIVRNHIWSEPTWVFVGKKLDQTVTFANVVDRTGTADGRPVHIFGLNNVITEPVFRGQGLSTEMISYIIEFMKNQDSVGLGLLFCADDLIGFYRKFGWRSFQGMVIVSQPTGEKIWSSNCMILPLSEESYLPSTEINLNGLPW